MNNDANANARRNNTGQRDNDALEELASLRKHLKGGAKEGAEKALEIPISQEDIEGLKRTLRNTQDDIIGDSLDELLETIVSYIEEHPNEYVLVKLLWIITILASPSSLGGFGKSLMTLAMIKALQEGD